MKNQIETALHWPALSIKLPKKRLYFEDISKILIHQHFDFIFKAQNALQDPKTDFVKLLKEFQQIPLHQRRCISELAGAYRAVLEKVEGEDSSIQEQLDALFYIDQLDFWMNEGFVQSYIVKHLDTKIWPMPLFSKFERRTKQKNPGIFHSFCYQMLREFYGLLWNEASQGTPSYQPPIERDELISQAEFHAVRANDPKNWELSHNNIAAWLPQIGINLVQGFGDFERELLLEDQDLENQESQKKAPTVNRGMLGFPWGRKPITINKELFNALCGIFQERDDYVGLKKFVHQFRKSNLFPFSKKAWELSALYRTGKVKQAIKQLPTLLQDLEQLNDQQRPDLYLIAESSKQLDLQKIILDSVEDKTDLSFLFPSVQLAVKYKDIPLAIQYIDQIIEKEPDNLFLLRYRLILLVNDSGQQNPEPELLLAARSKFPEIAQISSMLLGVYYARKALIKKAYIQFHLFQPESFSNKGEIHSEILYIYYYNFGSVLYSKRQHRKSIVQLRKAISIQQNPEAYQMLLHAATASEQIPLIRDYLPKALSLDPDNTFFQFLSISLEIINKNWKQVQEQLRAANSREFKTEFKDFALHYSAFSKAKQDNVFEAFFELEQELDFVLASEQLKELRQELLHELKNEYNSMKKALQKHKKKLKQSEQTGKTLKQEQKQNRTNQHILQKMLMDQNQLQFELRTLKSKIPKHKPDEQILSQQNYPFLFQNLPKESWQIFCDSQWLWKQYQANTNRDHSPIVLHLSRITEEQCNRRIIDPFIQYILSQEAFIADLPSPNIGRIKTENNRLSLGDITKLLHSQISTKAHDGSEEVLLNPYSNPKHRKLLSSFWELQVKKGLEQERAIYFQGKFILDLQSLSKLRNKASHEGKTQSRKDIESVREMLIGEGKKEGMIQFVLALGAL